MTNCGMDGQGWVGDSRIGILFAMLALGLTKLYSLWFLGPPLLRVLDGTVLNLFPAFGVLYNRYLVFLFLFMQVAGWGGFGKP